MHDDSCYFTKIRNCKYSYLLTDNQSLSNNINLLYLALRVLAKLHHHVGWGERGGTIKTAIGPRG